MVRHRVDSDGRTARPIDASFGVLTPGGDGRGGTAHGNVQ